MADSADPDQPAVGWRTDAAIAPRRQDAALYASDAPCTVRSSFRSFCSGPSTPRRHPRPLASIFGPPKTLPSPALPARPRRAMPPCSIFATASRRAWCRPKVRIPVDRRFASPNRPRSAARPWRIRQMGECRCRPHDGRRQRKPHPFHVRTVSLQGMKLMFERGPTARLPRGAMLGRQ